MLQNKKWVPYESATPNFEKKNIGDKERARLSTHFQKELESLNKSLIRL
jgi:hypothetical protein